MNDTHEVPPAIRVSREAVHLLTELVKALDATNWSSWQSTAKFDPALNNARDWLAAITS